MPYALHLEATSSPLRCVPLLCWGPSHSRVETTELSTGRDTRQGGAAVQGGAGGQPGEAASRHSPHSLDTPQADGGDVFLWRPADVGTQGPTFGGPEGSVGSWKQARGGGGLSHGLCEGVQARVSLTLPLTLSMPVCHADGA